MSLLICNRRGDCNKGCFHRHPHTEKDRCRSVFENCNGARAKCIYANSKIINVIRDGKVVHEYEEK